jgi:hypothetical protein
MKKSSPGFLDGSTPVMTTRFVVVSFFGLQAATSISAREKNKNFFMVNEF